MKTKKIKCWVEVYNWSDTPIVWQQKPYAREIKSAKEMGYSIYPAEIIIDLTKKL